MNTMRLFCCLALASFSMAQAQRLPSWTSAKWTYPDAEFKKIRLELDKLAFGPKTDKSEVDRLLRLHVKPHVAEFKHAWDYHNALNPLDFYWLIALSAYFPWETGKYFSGADYLLTVVPVPHSYEFARVAFCAYNGGWPEIAPTALADRLLKTSPKDVLVRMYITPMCRSLKSLGTWHDRAIQYAKELQAEFPNRPDQFVDLLAKAYQRHMLASNSRASYKRLMAYADTVVKNPAVSQEKRDYWRSEMKRYKEMTKDGALLPNP